MLRSPFISSLRLRVLVGIVTLLAAACSATNDEQQVRAVIEAGEKAAEARDTSDLLALIAEDYADAQGFDKAQLNQFLRAYFLTHPKIELTTRLSNIEFETANRVRLQVAIMMIGTQHSAATDSAMLAGEAETLQLELRRQESRWRVTRADRVAR